MDRFSVLDWGWEQAVTGKGAGGSKREGQSLHVGVICCSVQCRSKVVAVRMSFLAYETLDRDCRLLDALGVSVIKTEAKI